MLFHDRHAKMMDRPITNNIEDVLLEEVTKCVTDLRLFACRGEHSCVNNVIFIG
jgi:hypothetical protein